MQKEGCVGEVSVPMPGWAVPGPLCTCTADDPRLSCCLCPGQVGAGSKQKFLGPEVGEEEGVLARWPTSQALQPQPCPLAPLVRGCDSMLYSLQVVVQLSEDLLSQAVMMVENSRPTLAINLTGARQHWLEGMLRHEIGWGGQELGWAVVGQNPPPLVSSHLLHLSEVGRNVPIHSMGSSLISCSIWGLFSLSLCSPLLGCAGPQGEHTVSNQPRQCSGPWG